MYYFLVHDFPSLWAFAINSTTTEIPQDQGLARFPEAWSRHHSGFTSDMSSSHMWLPNTRHPLLLKYFHQGLNELDWGGYLISFLISVQFVQHSTSWGLICWGRLSTVQQDSTAFNKYFCHTVATTEGHKPSAVQLFGLQKIFCSHKSRDWRISKDSPFFCSHPHVGQTADKPTVGKQQKSNTERLDQTPLFTAFVCVWSLIEQPTSSTQANNFFSWYSCLLLHRKYYSIIEQ